jgi:hypothetical protein
MNEDHLDPDKHLWPDYDDNPLSEVKAMLQEHCSGRWKWARIDCCVTGKDADLEPCGQQGIEAIRCSDTEVECIAHAGVTVAGTDVALNCDDEEYEARLENYLAVAQELVCDIPGSGYWSGDDWYCSDEIPFTARLHFLDDDSLDTDKTWQSIIAAFDAAVAPWDAAVAAINEALEQAAGWDKTSGQKEET